MDGLGLEAGRLSHALGGAAGRSAQQQPHPFGREDAQNGIDDRRLADAGPAGDDQHLGHECEPDRGDLALGKGKTDTLLDPWQGLVRIDPGPRQPARLRVASAARRWCAPPDTSQPEIHKAFRQHYRQPPYPLGARGREQCGSGPAVPRAAFRPAGRVPRSAVRNGPRPSPHSAHRICRRGLTPWRSSRCRASWRWRRRS